MTTFPGLSRFAPPIRPQTSLRQTINAATRRPETECLPHLIELARQPFERQQAIAKSASLLIENLRRLPPKSGVQSLVHEYALNSQEGVALMCLAEALLRIPDDATRDALIRDKISGGDWSGHLGQGRSLFVNAATWGLVVTGRLTGSVNDAGLGASLTRLIGRLGEPVIRAGVDMAMRLMGEQFVMGRTIEEALANGRLREERGYRFSFDMLGEAAATSVDALAYCNAYENAIHAIGRGARGGPYEANGISIKLSALHPRYLRAQADRVMHELLPRVTKLAVLAKSYNIGFNIDAEEADRLEISLDLLESLCLDDSLTGWSGLGFVVQAYGKRCPFVIDFIVDLAKRSGRRIMVRLVKGAYWDSEIKRAQVDGQADYPVFTRKIHTDVSYIACASKLLAARENVFPQFATHNAQTLATIFHMAGPTFKPGDYEFQCLHGMGESLYDQVVSSNGLNRPCRIYAPVGTHETLLAYLVRRLLENGANSSFVHRIADPTVSVAELIADPVETARAMGIVGAPHEKIALPRDIYGARRNSAGLDLSDESTLAVLSLALQESFAKKWLAAPVINGQSQTGAPRAVTNPSRRIDVVGQVIEASQEHVDLAIRVAKQSFATWSKVPVATRASTLERAADMFEERTHDLMALIIRESGKSASNAIAEVREAVDFLRYYGQQARDGLQTASGLGLVVCISPWNFPLAIFTGQISAALAAGNCVVAKPAEETPLIAHEAVSILHAAGIPAGALQFLPGDGTVGAALVAAPETSAVMFTGSTEVARLINASLADRTSELGAPIPFIAETGGQNAMIVDSSALAEQVAADVMSSAFDSAGQRCSALRLLCLQDDSADRVLGMVKGALAELRLGDPCEIATDVGPVISEGAKAVIEAHIQALQKAGNKVTRLAANDACAAGSFVAPAIIEIGNVSELKREVFGPVLHVLRYRREMLETIIDDINATGYGLTFGLHTRLDETIDYVTSRIRAGNIYVNRNTIGAVVGVQPFGGRGLSGTGPKAGGPLYLHRLVQTPAPAASATEIELRGPVGERNLYKLGPRGRVLCFARTAEALSRQKQLVASTGNQAIEPMQGWESHGSYAAALIDLPLQEQLAVQKKLAALPGPIVSAHIPPYCPAWLMEEISLSINTTASGGNANLMAIG